MKKVDEDLFTLSKNGSCSEGTSHIHIRMLSEQLQ